MLRLRFVVEGQERVVPLVRGLRLGRGGDNDLVLPDVSVSRHHADVRRAGDGWVVEDRKSTNGVQVNRLPVQRAPLHPGDRLKVGVFELAVELAERRPGRARRRRRPPRPDLGRTRSPTPRSSGRSPSSPPPTASRGAADGRCRDRRRRLANEDYAGRIFGFLTRLARMLITSDVGRRGARRGCSTSPSRRCRSTAASSCCATTSAAASWSASWRASRSGVEFRPAGRGAGLAHHAARR